MKKIILLAFVTVVSAVFSTSCSDSQAIENEAVTQESTALRIMVSELKKANTAAKGFGVDGSASVFDFVYPITISFNNGTVVTVTSQEGLMGILNSESSELYISGIAFPFQVIDENGVTYTISDEDNFWEFIDNQGVATYDNYVFNPSCLELIYPLSFVTINDEVVTVPNEQALYDLFSDPNQETVIYDFVYPFNVLVNNQTVSVDSIYEFYELSSGCDENNIPCDCPLVSNPVCISLGYGAVMQYPNACFAICDGYTEADFVNCDDYAYSDISVFLNLGTCFNIVYPIQMTVLGNDVTVNDNWQVLEYLFELPNDASIEYPINVVLIETDSTFTFQDQETLSETLNSICDF